MRLREDGSTRFYGPRGSPIPEAPAPRRLLAEPVATLRRRHAELGLEIDATAGLPNWTPLDLALAVEDLRSFPSRTSEIPPVERIGSSSWQGLSAQDPDQVRNA